MIGFDGQILSFGFIHSHGLAVAGSQDGQVANLKSVQGSMQVKSAIRVDLPIGLIKVFKSWWRSKDGVNLLTTDDLTDMGQGATYYHCFVRIDPIVT
jgi:anaerobic selenocysteine-containing dehydrogenase